MRREKITDRVKLAAHVGSHRWRKLVVRFVDNPRFRWQIGLKVPERLLIAPQDLRTGDPTVANEVYAGEFAFSGKVVVAEGRSPFEIEAPSREWNEQLLGFGWLRHLRAAGTPIARENARALVGDWIALQGRGHPVAWEPEILTRRIISWLTQAPLILQDADHAFYRSFLRSLSRQVRYLQRIAFKSRDGYPRLLAAIALAFAGLCIADEARLLKRSTKRLSQELERQILPDGGHISRNPTVLVALLLDLLPLRQAYAARNLPPPTALLNAIDRMMPMLRFFRHGDGAFAQFNGAGATPADSIATVLAYDDARGTPIANASHSGYQRIEAGLSLIVADTGRPPPFKVSQDAPRRLSFVRIFARDEPHHRQLRSADDQQEGLAARRARDRRAFHRDVERHFVLPFPARDVVEPLYGHADRRRTERRAGRARRARQGAFRAREPRRFMRRATVSFTSGRGCCPWMARGSTARMCFWQRRAEKSRATRKTSSRSAFTCTRTSRQAASPTARP